MIHLKNRDGLNLTSKQATQKQNISNITHPRFYCLWIQAPPTYMTKGIEEILL